MHPLREMTEPLVIGEKDPLPRKASAIGPVEFRTHRINVGHTRLAQGRLATAQVKTAAHQQDATPTVRAHQRGDLNRLVASVTTRGKKHDASSGESPSSDPDIQQLGIRPPLSAAFVP